MERAIKALQKEHKYLSGQLKSNQRDMERLQEQLDDLEQHTKECESTIFEVENLIKRLEAERDAHNGTQHDEG
ncbi:hypothetical protein [Salsuginibacillus halophilus]|nr:hypothetical protein [Salsuginibacillus halophilus]